jgi:hypothetical protein
METKKKIYFEFSPFTTISSILVSSAVYGTLELSNEITVNVIDSSIRIVCLVTGQVVTFIFGKKTGNTVKVIINQGSNATTYFIRNTSNLRSLILSLTAGTITFVTLGLLEYVGRNSIVVIKNFTECAINNATKYTIEKYTANLKNKNELEDYINDMYINYTLNEEDYIEVSKIEEII